MYPYEIIFGLTLYDILIAAGVAAAILLFSYLADKRGIKKKLQSLVMACTLCAQIGLTMRLRAVGSTTGPPAESE